MNLSNRDDLFIGIDLGTGGVRALAVTATGRVVARSKVPLGPSLPVRMEGGHEQDPLAWWEAVCRATSALMGNLKTAGVPPESVQAMSIDGTSGTLVCLDTDGRPLRPAIMYNDARAQAEGTELTTLAGDFCRRLGYRFEASFALSKIVWVQRNEPELFARTAVCTHQADYILGRFRGDFRTSDYSNALKTGYDLMEESWPTWLEELPGVGERLPQVVAPGTPVGRICSKAAAQTGLPAGLKLVAGATDGTAGCLASGVSRVGDYNTTLGTTLIFKGISRQPCRHPDGLVYSHKLPGGYWLPGAASNTGGEWINTLFPGEDAAAMDAAAAAHLPVRCIAYPLVRQGERFPFLAADAEGFCVPEPASDAEHSAAFLQGVALVERLAYRVLDEVADTVGGEVFSTGGGSLSDIWMQCRADVTGRRLHRPAFPEAAFGSAILAATGDYYEDLWTAVQHMVHIEKTFVPGPETQARYDELFAAFCKELEKRGYL